MRDETELTRAENAGAESDRRSRTVRARAIAVTIAVAGACAIGPGALLPPASAEPEYDREASLRALAELFEVVDPPEVEVERWILPEEKETTISACLAGHGFTLLEDGVTWEVPDAQRHAYQVQLYTCAARFPTDPKYNRPWGDQQVAVQYDWTVNHVIPCLNERGYDITGLPSRAEFMRTFESAPFYPFSQVRSLENAAWAELAQACRQIAPSRLLFPG